jgi:hypothetical protein
MLFDLVLLVVFMGNHRLPPGLCHEKGSILLLLLLLQGQLQEEKNKSWELQRKLEKMQASNAKLEEHLERKRSSAEVHIATLEV